MLTRPTTYAEQQVITAIVSGAYTAGSTLPAERELALQLGVTRPTLREALQRLARDGWLTIRHGKSTLVNDFWRDGGLNVLGTLVAMGERMPANLVTQLLEIRLVLAPAYVAAAVSRNADDVADVLLKHTALDDEPGAFAAYDWRLHHSLTCLSGNPIYTLIANGFASIYEPLARRYFSRRQARERSRRFYAELLEAAQGQQAGAAAACTRSMMTESIALWQRASQRIDLEEFEYAALERLGR